MTRHELYHIFADKITFKQWDKACLGKLVKVPKSELKAKRKRTAKPQKKKKA